MLTKHILNLSPFDRQTLTEQLLAIGKPFVGRGSSYGTKMSRKDTINEIGISSRAQRWSLEYTYTTLKQLLKDQRPVELYYNLDLLDLTLSDEGIIANDDVPKELAEMRIQINQIKRLSMEEMIATTLTSGKTQRLLNFKLPTIIKRVKSFWSNSSITETSTVSMKAAKYLTIDILKLLKTSIDKSYSIGQINGILSELCIAIAIDVKANKVIMTRI